MKSWKRLTLATVLFTAAGYVHVNNPQISVPLDSRDAVADNAEFNTATPVINKDKINIPVPLPVAVPDASKGYIAGNDPTTVKPVEWVSIAAGKFMMGTDSGEQGFEDAKPVREVTIKAFEMSRSAVTVEQYGECLAKGRCSQPGTGSGCNWGAEGRQFHPINCVTWDQANQYAKFKGVRLPSESEWEYAATSAGGNQKYPWGNAPPTTDLAVMGGSVGTMPVCSKTAGNTAQGLCDMAGNVWQWVLDCHADSYANAPVDGRAYIAGSAEADRVVRGGSFTETDIRKLRADYRRFGPPAYRGNNIGFRIVRSNR